MEPNLEGERGRLEPNLEGERGRLEPSLEGGRGKEGGIGREVEVMCEFLCFLGTVSMAPLPILKRWR